MPRFADEELYDKTGIKARKWLDALMAIADMHEYSYNDWPMVELMTLFDEGFPPWEACADMAVRFNNENY